MRHCLKKCLRTHKTTESDLEMDVVYMTDQSFSHRYTLKTEKKSCDVSQSAKNSIRKYVPNHSMLKLVFLKYKYLL